jgi:uncharacterized protein (DUF305 family)
MMSPASFVANADCDMTGTSGPIKLKWNMFASEYGMYEVEGCEGVSPTLRLSAGMTYLFDQSDSSNWYHPVGFSYVAGGAHAVCKDADGAEGECPELGGEVGGSTLQYLVNGKAVTDDESGFGLDAYEPLFFNSQDWWGEQPAFQVQLTIPADASYTTVYYFCHIHGGMSAKIHVVGSSYAGEKTEIAADYLGGETEASALQVYADIVEAAQPAISAYDKECGTWNSKGFAGHSVCEGKHFLCGEGADDTYGQCLQAIDCQMHHDMAVAVPSSSTSKFATFARQMIAHHKNAVAMSKVLLKHMDSSDFPPLGTEDQDMEWAKALSSSIINIQNFQIQGMEAWLEANADKAGEGGLCYDNEACDCPGRNLLFASPPSRCPC